MTTATGDGSGGVVNYAEHLGNYLPQNCEVTLTDAGIANNDAVSRDLYMYLTEGEWDALSQGALVASNQTNMLTGAGAFYTNHHHRVHPLPYFLGKKTVDDPHLYVYCGTNTNGKYYSFYITLQVRSLNQS